MKKKNILIDKFYKKDYSIEKKIFGKNYNLISLNGKKLSPALRFLNKVDGVLAWHENSFDRKVLDQLRNCKIITRVGVGFNNVDLIHAKKKNIKVCNVPDYGINDVADHAMTFLFAFAMVAHMSCAFGSGSASAPSADRSVCVYKGLEGIYSV